jgi:Skp family chaperone for outer membrane proteins
MEQLNRVSSAVKRETPRCGHEFPAVGDFMDTRERIVIYGALAALAALNLAALFGQGGASALADGASDALGPAEALTLVDGDKQLVLRNRGERLAWSDSPHDRLYSIAFVHVGRAVGPLLEAEAYQEELARITAELQETDNEMTGRITAFLEENRDLKPDDPQAAEIQRAYQTMMQELERVRMAGTQRVAALQAEQTERAYRDFVAAVEVVAERRGIDIVLRFIPTADEFNAANPPAAFTAIRARLALKYPDGIDITDEVLQELALEL